MDRLPPLTALRAFEAAGRHMSFAKAAAELNVTPAALSFQIKSLEEHLEHPLFRRLNRAVELTEAGRALLPGASAGFESLHLAWRAARRTTETNVLNITAGPAFTAKWLAPRLFHFAQAHPEIELRFSASLRIMDFERDEVDVAIRFGAGQDEGLFSTPIFDEWLTPMMAPSLAAKYQEPEDLYHATLLHARDVTDISRQADWAAWFRGAGLGAVPSGGPQFSQPDHAVDAAIAGGGVALGRVSLTYGALAEGHLLAPFPLALKTDSYYRFVCPNGAEQRPHVAAFLDWVLEEARDATRFNEGRRVVHVKDL
ncbi:Glycine cleavage system transcriptional activator GcvA [Candidatus Rhodobacter oscarellae]|uniref:Glycine cleavage system transcriptional activator GcvA n=1 Tax=Candidatus Rhodobacter oscarellae TaxID=1675527 RepID=A0A0J9H2L1_9RHOB|nr:transcriptional regulator GcvA [Candidatus Rhodobacter lobularis]KMW59908.1 Glycine cleavage system transcriptional activator GcvA [Candidatus Rhodobacter lobularis]